MNSERHALTATESTNVRECMIEAECRIAEANALNVARIVVVFNKDTQPIHKYFSKAVETNGSLADLSEMIGYLESKFDRYYQMSDDPHVYRAGARQALELDRLRIIYRDLQADLANNPIAVSDCCDAPMPPEYAEIGEFFPCPECHDVTQVVASSL